MDHIIEQACAVLRTFPAASPRAVLDLVMEGFQDEAFVPVSPASVFGQLVAAAFDRGMEVEDWTGLLTHCNDSAVTDALLSIWRDEVWPEFIAAYRFNGANARVPVATELARRPVSRWLAEAR